VDFPYLIYIFYVRKTASLISSEKMLKGKLWAAHFLLVSLSRGVVDAPVCLLRESRYARLMLVADQWARPLLSVRVAPVAGGSWPFMILGLPRMIPCTVHERSSLQLSDGISCSVSGIDSPIRPFHSFLYVGTVPFFTFSFLAA
jgi:hypothetical protein